jgi:FkbM family methyltransferase
MSVRESGLYYLNKLVIGGIRSISRDKEADLAKWSGRLRRKSPTLPGRTYYGATFECDLRDHIMSRIFFFNVWEPSVSNVISNILRPGDLFVDVGANIGYDALLAAKLVGKEGKVVAIEAASAIFDQLRSNVDRNRAGNVRLVNMAVAKERGELTLYGGDEWNLGRTSPLAREGLHPTETVPMLALDEILTAAERSRVKLIKIDIEGGEMPVLQRLTETFDLYNEQLHILVEVSEEPTGLANELFRSLVPSRFKAFSVANDYSVGSYLESTAPVPPQPIIELPLHQTDVLFVPVGA